MRSELWLQRIRETHWKNDPEKKKLVGQKVSQGLKEYHQNKIIRRGPEVGKNHTNIRALLYYLGTSGLWNK